MATLMMTLQLVSAPGARCDQVLAELTRMKTARRGAPVRDGGGVAAETRRNASPQFLS